ncbi:MAG: cpaB [Rhizorhabdus sp.]|nr:cpaB [Rhizorhabdus sp.]
MLFGTRAKLTVAIGMSFALVFLALGISELRRPARAASSASAAVPQPAPALAMATAARAIRTGETITADLIRATPGDPLHGASIASPAEVVGKVATSEIPVGALIARSAIGSEDKLAIRVPVGMRAISIDTTDEIAVAGLIRPGDRVDIQAIYPGADAVVNGMRGTGPSRAETLLQLVQVLAVGVVVVGKDAPDPEGPDNSGKVSVVPPPARTVTLALSPEQVSTLALAKSLGALYLALRNPADQLVAVAPVAAAPAARAVARPAARAPVRQAAARPAAAHAIQLVVGDRRETIYSGGGSR